MLELRVNGHRQATIIEYPFLVSIQTPGSGHVCAGTLLSEYWVLTAAHCVTQNISLYRVRVGSSFWEYGGQVVGLAKIIPHHYYTTSFHKYDNDIALLRLKEPVTSRKAKPVEFSTEQIRILNQILTVPGWGLSSLFGGISDEIRVMHVPGYSYKACKAIYKDEVTKNMFCAGSLTKGTCLSDSGGPAIAGPYFVGMTLFGKGCVRRQPGVYINIQRYISWIQYITGLEM